MEILPPILILLTLLIILGFLAFKFDKEDILTLISSKNFFLLASLIIVFLLLSFYLFGGKEKWVADLLKIAIGVFVGAGATSGLSKNQANSGEINETSLSDINLSGDANKIAGRDINETIQNIEKAFGDIQQSITNENNEIKQYFNSDFDHSMHMIYSRSDTFEEIRSVIEQRVADGWTLSGISFAYEILDGAVIIFKRPKAGTESKFTIYRDSKFEQLYPR